MIDDMARMDAKRRCARRQTVARAGNGKQMDSGHVLHDVSTVMEMSKDQAIRDDSSSTSASDRRNDSRRKSLWQMELTHQNTDMGAAVPISRSASLVRYTPETFYTLQNSLPTKALRIESDLSWSVRA